MSVDEATDDALLGVSSLEPSDYMEEEEDGIELDDEFLAVATQVPIDYTMHEEELNEENNLVGLNNLRGMLAALNTCIRWVAWIAGTPLLRVTNRDTIIEINCGKE
ncbi:uncharacterized protein LOC119303910 [Triticum dicoccoides]|uniref:uncharacterized protein LOC119303910 n=1 Tax=Triticum dicoccoides TaxID=85692 RepID=UPI0018903651|nr:uncharacterized protein LOC119303910 [Triticum dicoccoides]